MAEVYGTYGDDLIAPGYTSWGVWGMPGDWEDIVYGDAGDDTIYGGPGDDYVSGGTGNDWIGGEEGNDYLRGGSGDDDIYGGDGDDEIWGGTGEDWLEGGDGNDTLRGGGGEDALFGGEGDDLLAGGSGDDYLAGGEGDDDLNGGGGMDLLEGGTGADYFYFYFPNHGPDIILDFNWQEGDKIVISSSGFGVDRVSLVYSDTPDEGEFGYTIEYVEGVPVTFLYYTDLKDTTHIVAALANYTALDGSDFVLI